MPEFAKRNRAASPQRVQARAGRSVAGGTRLMQLRGAADASLAVQRLQAMQRLADQRPQSVQRQVEDGELLDYNDVQQVQSQAKPVMQTVGLGLNGDAGSESEAGEKGERAATVGHVNTPDIISASANSSSVLQGQFFEKIGKDYVWHNEDVDKRIYHPLSETRYYYGMFNPLNAVYGAFPVFTKAAVDRSGKEILSEFTPEDTNKINAIFAEIQGTPYEYLIDYIERRIIHKLGMSVLKEFYCGAHIIFRDSGQVYRDLFEIAKPVAKIRAQTWGEWVRRQEVEKTPSNLATPSSKRDAGMGARRPELKETSHYTADEAPQLGIDLPGDLSGHILIGLVPNREEYGASAGHSFIQTEMYGFKSLYDHYIGHGQGFLWNFAASYQSGLIGFCKYSEKNKTEIREQDNPHKGVRL